MRRTGKTTRIIDFVVQQLLETGQCICTDHVAFDVIDCDQRQLKPFIDGVYARLSMQLRSEFKLRTQIMRSPIEGHVHNPYYVYFVLERIDSSKPWMSAEYKLSQIKKIISE